MKRKFCSLIILIFLMAYFSTPVFAQEATSSVSPMNWRQKLQEKIEVRKEKITERKEQIKTKLTKKAGNRVRNIYGRVRNRLQNRIERLEKITNRIKNRFLFFEEKGKDTTEARVKIAEAEEAIISAKNDLGIVDEKLEELLSSDEPKTALAELKTAVQTVRKDLSTARQALSKAVNSLVRQNQGGQNVEN